MTKPTPKLWHILVIANPIVLTPALNWHEFILAAHGDIQNPVHFFAGVFGMLMIIYVVADMITRKYFSSAQGSARDKPISGA